MQDTRKQLKVGIIATLALLVAVCAASAQVNPGGAATQAGYRNRQAETQVAELFNKVRRDASLAKLKRIEDRIDLQQLACTIAVTGRSPLFRSGCPVLGVNEKCQHTTSALYKTSNPREITSELERIAHLESPGHSSGYSRFAVAVWSVQQEAAGRPEYWVAIKLYLSAGAEFFEDHFTDAIEWKNDWKKFVAPECKQSK